MANTDGFVMDDEEIALWATSPEEAEYRYAGPPSTLSIVRGTALPKPQSPGSEFYRLPGSWQAGDRFLEIDVDSEFHDVEDLAALWARTKAAAAGMNAAGVQ
jgi:hypothetical protein